MKHLRYLILAAFALLTLGLAPAARAATAFATPAFQQQWQQGEALAPNFWGPLANATDGLQEPYQQAAGGQRLVQYFDKGRMELTNGVVTNGLLATELTTGQVQLGDAQFQFMPPPAIPIAGDSDGPGPTYAGLFSNGQALFAPAQPAVGAPVSRGVQSDGTVGAPVALPGAPPTIGTFDTATSHNVAAAFADYRNRVGLLTIGYAKSEPFTSTAKVAGVSRAVMAQVFERRILTYTPDNPAEFRVEMGNIGRQYYQWRYQTAQPKLTDGVWTWVETQMSDGAKITPGDPSKYTVQFNPDNTLAIQADCNQVTGSYAVNGPQLTITLGASTRVACPPGSQADVFLSQLGNIASYTFSGGELYLAIKLDSGIMHFTATKTASLTDNPWAWQGTRMSDGTTVAVGDPSKYTIQFNPDGSAAIRADCNQVTARYTVSGPQLTITLGASTTVACPPGSQADVFLSQIGQVASYAFSGGELNLTLRSNSGVMRFAALKPTSLTGTNWRATMVNNGRGGVESVRSGTELTAVFGTNGQVSGSGGCNTFNGGYQVSGASITIGPLATTFIACESAIATQEQAYLAALQAARTYAITASELELRDAGGALQVSFVAQPAAAAAVTGTVTYLERIALAPGSVVTVSLDDVSRQDVPAINLGVQVITTTGQQVPIPFSIPYNPATIDPRFTYAVSARIAGPDGVLLFITDTRYPVITNGAPTSNIELVLRRA